MKILNCTKCGKFVDTLAKRRHRCFKKKVAIAKSTNQLVLDHDHLPPHMRMNNRINLRRRPRSD